MEPLPNYLWLEASLILSPTRPFREQFLIKALLDIIKPRRVKMSLLSWLPLPMEVRARTMKVEKFTIYPDGHYEAAGIYDMGCIDLQIGQSTPVREYPTGSS
jgi:hypothetical protein